MNLTPSYKTSESTDYIFEDQMNCPGKCRHKAALKVCAYDDDYDEDDDYHHHHHGDYDDHDDDHDVVHIMFTVLIKCARQTLMHLYEVAVVRNGLIQRLTE